jgi:hypothetical protein
VSNVYCFCRLLKSVTSPAYVDSYHSSGSNDDSAAMKTIANEALAKMLAIDKCDFTTINPLFGSDLSYKCQVRFFLLVTTLIICVLSSYCFI